MKLMRLAPVFRFSILLASLLTVLPPPLTADTTVGGTISVDTTWTLAGSPYIVTSGITVQGADGADEITTLTIEPGVVVMFNSGQYMSIGNGSGSQGALIAQGTAAEPILFTSNKAVLAPGDWNYIRFYPTCYDAGTVMENCVMEYGGASPYYGTLYFSQASPTIRNVTVRNSKAYGAYIYSSEPVIQNCTFTANQNYDLFYTGTVGGSVTGSTFNSGISVATAGAVSFSGNTIHQNNAFPVKAYADLVGGISASTFTNVDTASYLQVSGTTITRDATWTAAIPYAVTSSITVQGADGADGITTLTIAPGAVVRFGGSSIYMSIGNASGARGALVAQGTAAEPIFFTSNQSVPAAGDWNYIRFYPTCYDAGTIIEHCVVEYGGASTGNGALYLYQASPRIQNTIIRYSKSAGIYAAGSETGIASINCNTFYGNQKGILWTASPPPEMHNNDFNGNTGYGLYYTGAQTLNAEDNWWGDSAGPNQIGDKTYGAIDFDPWSAAENDCSGSGVNYPPFKPSSPLPADNAVHVDASGDVTLSWNCGDPNSGDTLTYELYRGLSAEALQMVSSSIVDSTYQMDGLVRGTTYFWQIVARDSGGLETAGNIWRFTTEGDPPDLTITQLSTQPAGGMHSNSYVTLVAEVRNTGNGPVVDAFVTAFTVDGTAVGSITTSQIIPAGAAVQVTRNWYYTGGDPTITIVADSQSGVVETDEGNNQLEDKLSVVADITAPVLTDHTPAHGAQLQQVQQIIFSLNDSQSPINDAAVISGLTVTGPAHLRVSGAISEVDDTFTFVPGTLPLADGSYRVAVTAVDSFGNSQNYDFEFTIDTVPPAKPTITGGEVVSGIVQARPAQNSADRVFITLEGTREDNASIWVNGEQRVPIGSGNWSVQIALIPGENALEVYCLDTATNKSESEWADIRLNASYGITYQYNSAGRLKRLQNYQ